MSSRSPRATGATYLLPRSLASEANKGALAAHADQKKAQEQAATRRISPRRKNSRPNSEQTQLAVKAKAGGNGKLFGAVTNADVADAINEAFAVPIDKHKIEIKSQIKALGSYPVEIKLHKNVVAKATISVVAA